MWRQDDLVGSLDAPSKQPLPDVPGWDEFDARVVQARPAQPARRAADARHRRVQRDVEPRAWPARWSRWSAGTSIPSSCSTRSSAPRQQHLDRRRRVRQADPARARRRARPVGHLVAARDRLQRGDVVGGDQGRAAAPQPAADHDRQPRQQRGDRHGVNNTTTAEQRAATAGTARSSSSARTPRCSPRTAARCVPGSGERGRVALRGRTPVGYYKDEAKSASTFITFEGVRWSIPGDFAEVEADGTVRLLGRGSQCINTGGEKVYPEEVEEALKLHPTVADAAVVGVPDERFGEAITALVEPHAGAAIDEAALIAHVRRVARRVQGAEAGASPSTPSAAPRTASSTTSGSRPTPRSGSSHPRELAGHDDPGVGGRPDVEGPELIHPAQLVAVVPRAERLARQRDVVVGERPSVAASKAVIALGATPVRYRTPSAVPASASWNASSPGRVRRRRSHRRRAPSCRRTRTPPGRRPMPARAGQQRCRRSTNTAPMIETSATSREMLARSTRSRSLTTMSP